MFYFMLNKFEIIELNITYRENRVNLNSIII